MAKSKSPSRSVRPSRKSRKIPPSGVGQNQPIPTKKPPTIVPAPQCARIVQRYISGQSVRAIARAENRDRETIAKIIRSRDDEIKNYVNHSNEKFYRLANVALVSLARGLESSGWLALRFLEAVGVFPIPREEPPAVAQQLTADQTREAKTQTFFARFAADVYERSKAFDAPLVNIEADLHAGEGKSNGTAGSNEQRGTENDKPSSVVRRSILDFKDEN
jgi:hypothetical protein